MIEKRCLTCGKKFMVRRRDNRGSYCSKKCSYIGIVKKRISKHLVGKKAVNWRGGLKIHPQGYVSLWVEKNKYALEHRIVMEKHINRKLEVYEKVHHKNGIKDDNRIENLEIVISNPHYGEVKCPHCRNTFLIR